MREREGFVELKDAAAKGAAANVVAVEDGRHVDITMKTLFAFAITFIVAGHVITGPGNGGINFAYNMFPPASFHVACFVFVAGYFYKTRYEEAPLSFLKKRFLRLIVPLYVINALYGLWVLVSRNFGFTFGEDPSLYNLLLDPLFGGHAFRWNLSMWFVAPLFCTEVVDFCLRLLLRVGESKRKELVLIVLYAAIGIATTTLCGRDGFEEYSSSPLILLARTGFFLPCYAMGRIYRLFLAERDTAPNWIYFGVVLTLQLIVIVVCNGNIVYLVSWCKFFTGRFVPFVTTALGIAFWLRVSRIVSPGLVGSKTARLVADNTYSIMANQFVGIFLVKLVFFGLFCAGFCQNFDVNAFLTDFWYYYVPEGFRPPMAMTFGIVYVVPGIIVPIGMHGIWGNAKLAVQGRFKRHGE